MLNHLCLEFSNEWKNFLDFYKRVFLFGFPTLSQKLSVGLYPKDTKNRSKHTGVEGIYRKEELDGVINGVLSDEL